MPTEVVSSCTLPGHHEETRVIFSIIDLESHLLQAFEDFPERRDVQSGRYRSALQVCVLTCRFE